MGGLKDRLISGNSRASEGGLMKRYLGHYKAMMKRPEFPKRDLERMLRELTMISTTEMGAYAFSRDPLKDRFRDGSYKELAQQAVDCGRGYAKRVAEEYGSTNPQLILRELGIKVDFVDMPSNTDRVLFAEFLEPDQVYVYLDAVNKAESLLKRDEIRKLLTLQLDIRQTLLAHELFHVLEIRNRKEIFTQTYRYQLWKLGPIRSTSRVQALGEIAAMAFAQELLNLPYSVYVLDVLLLYGYSENEASGLYEEMMRSTGRTPCPGLTHLELLERRSREAVEKPDEK